MKEIILRDEENGDYIKIRIRKVYVEFQCNIDNSGNIFMCKKKDLGINQMFGRRKTK